MTLTRSNSSSMAIQAVYELCKKSFTPSGIPTLAVPTAQRLCSLLEFCKKLLAKQENLTPADVGLKVENLEGDRGYGFSSINPLSRSSRWTQPITYVDIFQSNSFTMCIFCFPTSSVIPLHDHPGMTVFSKVLYGSLHVKGYDWVDPQIVKTTGPDHSQVQLAKLSVDKVLTASSGTSVLYPNMGGNLHCFTAISPCAVLDILTPPYDENLGRGCTYYNDYAYSSFSNKGGLQAVEDEKEQDYAWLGEIDTPDDLYMVSGVYSGPPLQI